MIDSAIAPESGWSIEASEPRCGAAQPVRVRAVVSPMRSKPVIRAMPRLREVRVRVLVT